MNCTANQRVIALVDMDCFFCQVETRLDTSLKGKPLAVVQYNQWKGGGIIAVNYEARDRGVTRFMRGDEAKEKCPEIVLVSVPTVRGKADLTKNAGEEVAKVFSEFCECVQRASIDEAFLDLSKEVQEYIKTNKEVKPQELANTFIVGHCNLGSKNEEERAMGVAEWLKLIESDGRNENPNFLLAVGGLIVEKMRSKIFEKTGFHCSAGIAHNKILAKLTAGLHKPQKQTILPQDSVPELYETLPIHKVRNLGGKFGKQVCQKLAISTMSELYGFTLNDLQQKFDDKTGHWLFNIARGIDLEPVTPRLRPESVGCSKNFTGLNQLTTKAKVEHWIKEMACEISERLQKDLEKNKRRAKLLTVSVYQESATSKCGPLNSYDANKIATDAMQIIKKFNTAPADSDVWRPSIKLLGLSASKFTDEVSSIEKFLKGRNPEMSQKDGTPLNAIDETQEQTNVTPSTSRAVEIQSALKTSFILNYLQSRQDKMAVEASKRETKEEEEESDANEWVSLSELIPDVNQAEADVVDMLPEPLKRKFRERLNSNSKNLSESESSAARPMDRFLESNLESQCPSETCNECGKKIPLNVFLEHLDYHVALKLSSEINAVAPASVKKKTVIENDVCNKRKKGSIEANSKKMKSITAFFAVAPK
ncbi:hypothetical protein RUM44_006909 [Polyplax serrata]|uniref:DNA polymerase eta n=1 Tax=Polyplax serrata TaxID=468196 RepID=A0ABR1B0V2_POLSC